MNSMRDTKRMLTRTAMWIATFVSFVTWTTPAGAQRRDRGVNQPGAAGNRGGVDPGINQPGAAGNRGVPPAAATPIGYGGSARQVRAVGDPGLNQPGAAGNVGRDPGINQPGAAGNRR